MVVGLSIRMLQVGARCHRSTYVNRVWGNDNCLTKTFSLSSPRNPDISPPRALRHLLPWLSKHVQAKPWNGRGHAGFQASRRALPRQARHGRRSAQQRRLSRQYRYSGSSTAVVHEIEPHSALLFLAFVIYLSRVTLPALAAQPRASCIPPPHLHTAFLELYIFREQSRASPCPPTTSTTRRPVDPVATNGAGAASPMAKSRAANARDAGVTAATSPRRTSTKGAGERVTARQIRRASCCARRPARRARRRGRQGPARTRPEIAATRAGLSGRVLRHARNGGVAGRALLAARAGGTAAVLRR